MRIAENLDLVVRANQNILEVVQEIEEERETIKITKATEKIGAGAMELLNQIA